MTIAHNYSEMAEFTTSIFIYLVNKLWCHYYCYCASFTSRFHCIAPCRQRALNIATLILENHSGYSPFSLSLLYRFSCQGSRPFLSLFQSCTQQLHLPEEWKPSGHWSLLANVISVSLSNSMLFVYSSFSTHLDVDKYCQNQQHSFFFKFAHIHRSTAKDNSKLERFRGTRSHTESMNAKMVPKHAKWQLLWRKFSFQTRRLKLPFFERFTDLLNWQMPVSRHDMALNISSWPL